ncbi:unnamed protein product, partial [Polarella glacialis]
MAAEEAEQASAANLGCTEDEPDDDFQPDLPGAKATGSRKSAAAANDQVTEESAAAALPALPPLLTGPWQQLEGAPRPPGAGPRLLAWNEHGHVASYPDQLRVEVHRHSEEKPQRIADYDGLQMAAVSEGACCLAAGSGAAGGSRILIRPSERWEKAVFSAPLGSAAEAPEAVACGGNFVAVLTSSRMLRLYTFSGMPMGLLSMPGRSVALAARGPLLLVVTGRPLAASESQDADFEDVLDFRLLDVRTRIERSAGRLPLSPASRLRWLGFAEDLVPIAIDTSGVVRALLGSGAGSWGPAGGTGGEWTPVLSLAEHEEDGPLWAVHALQGSLVFAEIGASAAEPRAPPEAPKEEAQEAVSAEGLGSEGGVVEPVEIQPVFFGVRSSCQLRTLSWRLPIGPFPTAGDAIEGAFREQLLARHAQDMVSMALLGPEDVQKAEALEKKSKQSALKLFHQLASAQEVERAHHVAQFSLASSTGSFKVLDMAQKLAEKANQYRLADAVAALPRHALVPQLTSAQPQ